ncbi:ATP-binding cassette sub-family A member 17 [Caerostris darwini]|uniref:ATP-binding cassette sub-family A member 17 n=1 Tax=Caerostris darwini TaxID=1538125 RepID=A0AAV4QZZ4_9ARAC|nr:ATP-binding cassette sub-family A member 17 [Caerostris darwini]
MGMIIINVLSSSQIDYWSGPKSPQTEVIESFCPHELKPEFFEKDPLGPRPTIEFKHVTKVFKKGGKPSVEKLSLKAYRNQITVLLGHESSGKSTAVSLLLGKYRPTSGKAFIKGCNVSIKSESRIIPRFLGFCPDHDVFFDHLSVEENMYFFCKMKDFESEGLKSQIDHILGILDLELKRKSVAGSLSPGWQRKLSVAAALVGESEVSFIDDILKNFSKAILEEETDEACFAFLKVEVVVMDNPTSRMDSYSRRIVWEALKTEKTFRTIFITTAYMREAEAIGDRIGVIDGGELQKFGSADFIKKNYGAGYHLIIEKDESCTVSDVTSLVNRHAPGSKLHSSNGTLKYVLPPNKTYAFQFLFSELEEKKEALKVNSYYVTRVTMKELFDKVSLKAQSPSLSRLPDFGKEAVPDDELLTGLKEDSQNVLFIKERNQKFTLFFQQGMAVLKNRCLFSLRNILLLLSQLLAMPLIFFSSNIHKEYHTNSPTVLSLGISGAPVKVQYSVDPSDKKSKELSDIYASLFHPPHQAFLVDSREENLNEHLLEIAEADPFEYYKKYFMAADFSSDANGTSVTAFYHNKAIHSPALSLLFAHNAILRSVTKSERRRFQIINHPLQMKNHVAGIVSATNSLLSSFLVAQDLLLSVSIVMAGFMLALVRMRASYLMCRFYYWTLTFLYDFGLYLLACVLLLATFAIAGSYGSRDPDQLGRITLVLVVHGVVGLLFVYCCSFFPKSPATGYIFIFLYYILGLAVIFILSLVEDNLSSGTYESLDTLFSLCLPCYSFGQAFLNLNKNWVNNQACNKEEVLLSCEKYGDSVGYFLNRCCKGKYLTFNPTVYKQFI